MQKHVIIAVSMLMFIILTVGVTLAITGNNLKVEDLNLCGIMLMTLGSGYFIGFFVGINMPKKREHNNEH